MSTTATADMPASDTALTEPLHLPAGSFVVLAGLPGAGKTTLLRRLSGTEGVGALDSEHTAARLRHLPAPYPLLRPLAHALHLLHVALAVHTSVPVLLTTDPYTSRRRRRLLRAMARLSGRSLHVVLIDASPDEARDGRARRGRDLPARRAARHERRYRQLPKSEVDQRLTRQKAARVIAAIVLTPSDRRSTAPLTAARTRRRPGAWIPVVATLAGLWFGLTAPDVSPVLPAGVVRGAAQGITVLDQDPDGPAPAAGGGRRDSGPGDAR